MKQTPHEVSPRLVTIHALVLALAVTGSAPERMAQEERRETVIQKAFEQSPENDSRGQRDIE